MVDEQVINPTVWYESKNLWLNAMAIIVLVAQAKYGFIIAPEEQVALFAVANLILRALSHGGLKLKK